MSDAAMTDTADKSTTSALVEEARAIARDVVIYAFPLVDSYRIQHGYFVDRGGPEFKAPWNAIFNNTRVYTPDDKVAGTYYFTRAFTNAEEARRVIRDLAASDSIALLLGPTLITSFPLMRQAPSRSFANAH